MFWIVIQLTVCYSRSFMSRCIAHHPACILGNISIISYFCKKITFLCKELTKMHNFFTKLNFVTQLKDQSCLVWCLCWPRHCDQSQDWARSGLLQLKGSLVHEKYFKRNCTNKIFSSQNHQPMESPYDNVMHKW